MKGKGKLAVTVSDGLVLVTGEPSEEVIITVDELDKLIELLEKAKKK